MFFAVKKKTVLLGCLMVCAAAVLVICGALHERQEIARAAFSVPAANKVVVIDAGHGALV